MSCFLFVFENVVAEKWFKIYIGSRVQNRPRYKGERASPNVGHLNIRNTKFEPTYQNHQWSRRDRWNDPKPQEASAKWFETTKLYQWNVRNRPDTKKVHCTVLHASKHQCESVFRFVLPEWSWRSAPWLDQKRGSEDPPAFPIRALKKLKRYTCVLKNRGFADSLGEVKNWTQKNKNWNCSHTSFWANHIFPYIYIEKRWEDTREI